MLLPYCIPCDHIYSTCGMHIECTSLFFRTSHFTWNAQRVTFLEIICFYIFFFINKKKHDKKKKTAKCECIPESVSAYFAWFARSDTRDGRVFFHRQHIILLIFILFITKKEIYTPHASHSTFNTTKIFNHISPTHLEPSICTSSIKTKDLFFCFVSFPLSFLHLSNWHPYTRHNHGQHSIRTCVNMTKFKHGHHCNGQKNGHYDVEQRAPGEKKRTHERNDGGSVESN